MNRKSLKKKKPQDKNSFLQFKGLTKGKGDPIKALLEEKKREIEHDRKKWGI